MPNLDPFNAKSSLTTAAGDVDYFRLDAVKDAGFDIDRLPVSIKILLEAALRNVDDFIVTRADVEAIANWNAADPGAVEIPFMPGRVVLQDFTGVPAVVDLAALRDGCAELGGDVSKINPLVPCDLVIDHSVQVDHFATEDALDLNLLIEFQRNNERYEFLKWGQQAFDNFSVVPPGTGIVHQVNLEYLAKAVMVQDGVAFPDSLVGTDSHTTMINGLGVVGWGVGGIEAEAVMLGQPIYMLLPRVTGFKLTGTLPEGATATDLVLMVTQQLRAHGVVGRFVEFFGPGMAALSLPDRATIANMAPEYGATMGFFPIDEKTLDYMTLTGRDEATVDLVEKYCKAQGLWRNDSADVQYTDVLELDLADVVPSLAGPKRPQDRIALTDMRTQWRSDLDKTFNKSEAAAAAGASHADAEPAAGEASGTAVATADPGIEGVSTTYAGDTFNLKHGAVVIAAITSCTNTSNPDVLVAAGLVARAARAKGLTRKPWVKTSLAPGSRVVTDYLEKAKLDDDLDAIGFATVGYGCTTCIGNSGPLPPEIAASVESGDLVVSSVLSGNRNFEGRISPHVKANYLASPPLVVAYAIAGTTDIDLSTDPLGTDTDGNDVYLKDIWPTTADVHAAVAGCVTREQFTDRYSDVDTGPEAWQKIDAATGDRYAWKADSTYIQNPPFFRGMNQEPGQITPITGARCLALLGDSVTTDHISPAGAIKPSQPAGKYLQAQGVERTDFNSFGSRRGNHEVMMRGTFDNIRVRNQLAPNTEGGFTTYLGPDTAANPADTFAPDESVTTDAVSTIYDAATGYQQNNIPTVVLAGVDYGMGSSRDWAAKGTFLLGVKAVIAQSYERIHRSNLVGMGVLPLQFAQGDSPASLGLTGHESFDIAIDPSVKPGQDIQVTATKPDGSTTNFTCTCRIDTPVEVEYYQNGGILHTVLRKIAAT